MPKKKAATAAPKPAPKAQPSQVPCVRVVIGGKQGSQGSTTDGCKIVGEARGGTAKFNLGREFKATSKSVLTPKKNKPCLGALNRKGCPVQLAFDKGQPFLRFCTTEKQAGIRIDVNDPKQAQAEAERMCGEWKATGKFTSTSQLGKARRG